MALAAAGAFEDLRSLVLGDHALELYEQLILRRSGLRCVEEYGLDAVPSKLLDEQNLVSVLAA